MNNILLPYKILFVEDEDAIRENYVQYLAKRFNEVHEAIDGEDALKKYQTIKPNIMIVDLNIPKINGLDLIKKIRASDQKVKIIMLTAMHDKKFLLQAVELKLIRYLIKPISRDELKETLDLAIEEISKYELIFKKNILLPNECIWAVESKTLSYNGKIVPLTNKETLVMSLFVSRLNYIFSFDEIITEVWGNFDKDRKDSIKTIVKNLRHKLPIDTISNIFGVGYTISR